MPATSRRGGRIRDRQHQEPDGRFTVVEPGSVHFLPLRSFATPAEKVGAGLPSTSGRSRRARAAALGAFRCRQQAHLPSVVELGREGKMPARPSWQGHLRLSLVTCPVALYPATSEADTVRFN